MRNPRTQQQVAKVAVVLGLALGACAGPRFHGPHHPNLAMTAAETRKPSELPYPWPEEPTVETLLHVPTGLPLQATQLSALLAGNRVVYIGETHDNTEVHRAEAQVLDALLAIHGDQVVLAMEMFRTPQQPVLDRWSRGELDEGAFVAEVGWAKGWGGDFALYRPLLERAKRQHLDVLALNPSDDLQKAVRQHGWSGIPADLRSQLPERGPDDPWQRQQLQAVFGAHAASPERFEKMWRIQMLWEEHMAQRLSDYLKSPRGQGKVVLVVAGGWHVRYGFGVPKKLMRRLALRYLTICTEEIAGSAEDTPDRHMSYSAPAVPLYPADVLWWLPFSKGKPAVTAPAQPSAAPP